ncbi:hypothetical protein NE857_26750 [Nocardiopsis exhalans]|uniref:Uncharacterized protein n=1 Tax=Nocardiopsis exhalans TaxID=163604 RepID=A0ABY5D386_9ACTN|nr:hypothetical protein [Nocardiopsis exhalans]USY18842.1 hypothetical protein NE857_26750 [Nocardiopsis exhalans]
MLSIGCVTILLLIVAAGVGGAYYLGWIGGNGKYDSAPSACGLVDVAAVDAAVPGLTGDMTEEPPRYSNRDGLACLVGDEWGDDRMYLTVIPYSKDEDGFERRSADEKAEIQYGNSWVPDTRAHSETGPGGVEIRVGEGQNLGYAQKIAVTQFENLVVEARVEASIDEGRSGSLSESESEELAVALLVHAVEQLP